MVRAIGWIDIARPCLAATTLLDEPEAFNDSLLFTEYTSINGYQSDMRALSSKAEYQASEPRIFQPRGAGSHHFSPSPGSHQQAKPALIVLLLESASLLHNQNLLAQA